MYRLEVFLCQKKIIKTIKITKIITTTIIEIITIAKKILTKIVTNVFRDRLKKQVRAVFVFRHMSRKTRPNKKLSYVNSNT